MTRFLHVAGAGIALSLWSAVAPAQDGHPVLVRQLAGDLAIEVRVTGPGALRIGAADGSRSIVTAVLQSDLRRWADSAGRVLAARPPRRGQSARWEAVVAGPGVAAGSMSLARTVAPADTAIVLLITNAEFEAVRTTITMAEARGVVGALRRASMWRPPPPR
jgi:hypothetical protein